MGSLWQKTSGCSAQRDNEQNRHPAFLSTERQRSDQGELRPSGMPQQASLSLVFYKGIGYLCIYFWLRWSLHCCTGFSLVVASMGLHSGCVSAWDSLW